MRPVFRTPRGKAGLVVAGLALVAGIVGEPGPARAQASDDYMAFALDMQGTWGHGRGATVQDAQRTALNNCASGDCRITERPVQTRCQALADYREGGYWYGIGAADTNNQAVAYAAQHCAEAAPGMCTVRYSYCK
jgi:hypothetical protein